jgi:hypothetical protein
VASRQGDLVQDGTTHATNLQNHQPFWEVATASGGGSGQAFPQGGAARANDTIVTVADTQSQPGYASFSVYDYTTGASWNATVYLHGASSSGTAEVVAERPQVGGSYPQLSDFGTLTFQYAAAARNASPTRCTATDRAAST